MNWINKVIEAGKNIKRAIHKRATKEDIANSDWISCCKGPQQKIIFENNMWVCPECNDHKKIKPKQRFEYLFDNGKYEILETKIPKDDPLEFVDSKPYKDRLKAARKKTGLKCSMVVATGSIKGINVTTFASDFDFMGASIGAAEGEAILFAAQHAIENNQPLVAITSGGGMKMQESLISLSQMPRSILAINEVKRKNLPYIVLLTNPTAGGITASYAMVGDIHLAESNALIAFAGARVIAGTVKEALPEGFQRASYVQKTGFVDLVVNRKDIPDKIGTLLSILLKKNSAISAEENETSEDTQSLSKTA